MIVFCAADLIWSTRIKSTADALGIPCRPVRNLDMLSARLGDSPVAALIVDLEAGNVVFDLIRHVRAHENGQPPDPISHAAPTAPAVKQNSPIHILAFGPHVATDLFAQARAAGADSVMARGAFDARLPDVLRSLSPSSAT